MGAPYERALDALLSPPKFRLEGGDPQWPLQTLGAHGLALRLNGRGLEGRWSGPLDGRGAVLEGFCVLCSSLSPAEAKDQGALWLEYQCRDSDAPPPVAGVLSPLNLPEPFSFLYRILQGFEFEGEKRRFSCAVWQGLPVESRRERVVETLRSALRDLGCDEGFTLETSTTPQRWVLHPSLEPSKSTIPPLLLTAERTVREALDWGIEILLGTRKDKNRRDAEARTDHLHSSA